MKQRFFIIAKCSPSDRFPGAIANVLQAMYGCVGEKVVTVFHKCSQHFVQRLSCGNLVVRLETSITGAETTRLFIDLN